MKLICIALCTIGFDGAMFIAYGSDVCSLVHVLTHFQSLCHSTVHTNPIQSSAVCLYNFTSRLCARKSVGSPSSDAVVIFSWYTLSMLTEDVCWFTMCADPRCCYIVHFLLMLIAKLPFDVLKALILVDYCSTERVFATLYSNCVYDSKFAVCKCALQMLAYVTN